MGCSETRSEKTKDEAKKFSFNNQFTMYGAIQGNQIIVVLSLIDNGFLIDLKMPSFTMKSSLHIAAEFGRDIILKELIARKGDINSQDSYGLTPIFYAVKNRHVEIAKTLDKYGADLSIVSSQGFTIKDYIPKGKKKNFPSFFKKVR